MLDMKLDAIPSARTLQALDIHILSTSSIGANSDTESNCPSPRVPSPSCSTSRSRQAGSVVRRRARRLSSRAGSTAVSLDEALGLWTQAIQSDPGFSPAYVNRAKVLLQKKQVPQALDDLNRAVEIDPSCVPALLVKATTLNSCRSHPDAAEVLLHGLRSNPSDSRLNSCFEDTLEKIRLNRPYFSPPRKEQVVFGELVRFATPEVTPREEAPDTDLMDNDWESMLRRLNDIIDPTEDPRSERRRFRDLFREHMDMFVQTFGYYQALRNDPKGKLCLRSFWRFCRDCKLPGHGIPIAVIDRHWLKCVEPEQIPPNYTHDPHEPTLLCDMIQWVESVVRISHAKYPHIPRPSDRFAHLLVGDFIPNATHDSLDRLAQHFASTKVQAVFDEFMQKLKRIFRYFVLRTQDKSVGTQERQDVTMSFNMFLRMLIDCNVIDPNLNVKRAVSVFTLITRDEEIAPQEHVSNASSEMIFDEFLESVVRMTRVKYPDVNPVEDAIRLFLTKEIFPMASRIIPGRL